MNSAHWIWNYQAFLSELEDNFGPHNPVSNAKKALNELTMKKGTHIVKYNIDFWELASRVSWNEAALCDQYFCGLPLMNVVDTQGEVNQQETKAQLTTTAGVLDM